MKPIYTIYESMIIPDTDTWGPGYMVGVTHWSSKRKVKKALRQHYESMVAYKLGDAVKFYEGSGLNNPYFEFTRWGNRYRRWIAQHILV